MKKFSVRASRCHYLSSDDRIYATLRDTVLPLERSMNRLKSASKILIKSNMIWWPDRIRYFAGRRQELVDYSVMRAVLRLLREETEADLAMIDATYAPPEERPGPELNYPKLLEEFGVRFIDSNEPPFSLYETPGGGLMFGRYQLHSEIGEADAVVSVATMKSHAFMGNTLCMKNLFGLTPIPPHGRDRRYFHHIIRLPYVLADLSMIINPCLNIIDGLVGQTDREWGGRGRIANVLIAGDHPVATDACGAWLMGHDPNSDYPSPPYRRDRNHIRVASEAGFGTNDLSQIDFVLDPDIKRPVADFDSVEVDSPERVASWHRTTCQQALFYRDHAAEIVARYPGEFVLLQDGEIVWHGSDFSTMESRRRLSGTRKDSAMFLKLADPNEIEDEHFQVYEKALARFSG